APGWTAPHADRTERDGRSASVDCPPLREAMTRTPTAPATRDAVTVATAVRGCQAMAVALTRLTIRSRHATLPHQTPHTPATPPPTPPTLSRRAGEVRSHRPDAGAEAVGCRRERRPPHSLGHARGGDVGRGSRLRLLLGDRAPLLRGDRAQLGAGDLPGDTR